MKIVIGSSRAFAGTGAVAVTVRPLRSSCSKADIRPSRDNTCDRSALVMFCALKIGTAKLGYDPLRETKPTKVAFLIASLIEVTSAYVKFSGNVIDQG